MKAWVQFLKTKAEKMWKKKQLLMLAGITLLLLILMVTQFINIRYIITVIAVVALYKFLDKISKEEDIRFTTENSKKESKESRNEHNGNA